MNRILEVVLTGNNAGLKGVLATSAAEVKAFQGTVSESNEEVSGTAEAAQISLAAVAAAGVVLGTAMGYAVMRAAEFEVAMRNVNSLTGLNEEGFASLSAQVLEMSTRLPQSATTLAEGLYDIASSGFQGADGMLVLESAAQAASAGLTTTAVSAKAITSVLNAYGLGAEDAADVSDVLFQTVNLGVLSFDELGGSIGSVVGTAAAASVKIDEVGAALATMTLSGINGAEAATSLNNLLEGLINPSEALADTYADLGYESGESALATDGLRGVLEKLRVATGGNVTELLALFPSIQAARGALALMNNEGAKYAEVSEQLTDKEARQGATARVLAEQMKGVSNQFAVFKNEADAAAITLGTKVLPAIIVLMDVASNGIGILSELGAEIGERLAPFMGSLISIGEDLVTMLISVWEAAGPVVTTLAAIAGLGIIAVLNGVAYALEKLVGWAADAPGVITPIIITLGLLAVASSTAGTAIGLLAVGMVTGQGVAALQAIGWTRLATALQSVGTFASSAALMVRSAGSAAMGNAGGMAAFGLATAAARTAIVGLLTSLAPLLVIAAAIGVTMRIIEVSNAAEDAKEKVDGLTQSFDDAPDGKRYSELAGALDSVRNAASTAKSDLEDLQDDSFWEQFWSMDYAGDVELAQAAVDETTERLAELEAASRRAETSIDALGARFNLSKQEVLDFAEANGIDLTGALTDVQGMFAQLQHVQYGNADEETHDLIDAMGALTDEAASASEKVDALKDALDALGGKTVSVFEAQSQLAQSVAEAMTALEGMDGVVRDGNGNIDALASGVINADGTLNALSATGQTAGAALIQMRNDGNDLITTLREQGATNDEVAAANQGLRDSFIRAAGQMGITGETAEALATSILGIPDQRNTAIAASGTETAMSQIQALQRQIDALTGKTVFIDTVNRVVTSNTGDSYGLAVPRGYVGRGRDGGIRGLRSFREGGTYGFGLRDVVTGGRLPTTAGIASDGAELVHWAEKGTGGEAFVPLGNRDAPRSQELVRWLYSYFFPAQAQAFAAGGTRGVAGYTPSVPSTAYAPAAPVVSANVEASVKVFMGNREITDIVDVQVDSKLSGIARNARAAGAR